MRSFMMAAIAAVFVLALPIGSSPASAQTQQAQEGFKCEKNLTPIKNNDGRLVSVCPDQVRAACDWNGPRMGFSEARTKEFCDQKYGKQVKS